MDLFISLFRNVFIWFWHQLNSVSDHKGMNDPDVDELFILYRQSERGKRMSYPTATERCRSLCLKQRGHTREHHVLSVRCHLAPGLLLLSGFIIVSQNKDS